VLGRGILVVRVPKEREDGERERERNVPPFTALSLVALKARRGGRVKGGGEGPWETSAKVREEEEPFFDFQRPGEIRSKPVQQSTTLFTGLLPP